mgnify:CR=1 FL=1
MTLKWYGKEINDLTKAAASQALHDAAEFVLTESNKIAPKDSGDLRASAFVSDNKSKLQSTINYDEPYAVAVHEGGPKNWQEPGTQDKFLETALKENADAVIDFLSDALEEVLN